MVWRMGEHTLMEDKSLLETGSKVLNARESGSKQEQTVQINRLQISCTFLLRHIAEYLETLTYSEQLLSAQRVPTA